MKTLNDSPARYAAQLAETIGSLHRHLAAEQPDWWQKVVAELHSRLDKEFPPFGERPDDTTVMPKAPDWLPGMEYARINALECRIGTLEAFLDFDPQAPADDALPDCVHDLIAEGMTGVTRHAESRIESLSERLAIWEQWAAKQEKRIDDTLHFCDESAVALVTVLGNATDKRIDAVVKQTELLQSLVLNVKELLLNVDARLDDLETARPC